ncbi:ATPase/histidine kinase/DNA gyrase B/HSP90 domain protein [Paenibacillus sp. HGF7]|nr:ATPase/histidine kinase/DNA gyrase B/HSP90 domain protein [Paenibacillus sp. HGF7]EPD81231.1 hypothetical protein HMPREF1207_04988 [Paenibacillus sp. HGH0039]
MRMKRTGRLAGAGFTAVVGIVFFLHYYFVVGDTWEMQAAGAVFCIVIAYFLGGFYDRARYYAAELNMINQELHISREQLRRSDERYSALQASLDRFSHDLFGIMKIAELEARLLAEVKLIFQIDRVFLIETQAGHPSCSVKVGMGEVPRAVLDKIRQHQSQQLSIGEVFEYEEGSFLKIGEIKGRTFWLIFGELTDSTRLPVKRIWLKTLIRYVNVVYENLTVIEDLSAELKRTMEEQEPPTWLLRLFFSLSEHERKRLSQDLHDAALQEQIIWYRKLEQLRTSGLGPDELKEGLAQIGDGLLDVMYQIRLTCNELRPPFLKEWGLVQALEALFDHIQLHANFTIYFEAEHFRDCLNDEQRIAVYRITQELMSNAMKHSKAEEVHVTLTGGKQNLLLSYRDNGVGTVNGERKEPGFGSMGIYGMQQRVRSLQGEIQCVSDKSGLKVQICIPLKPVLHVIPLHGTFVSV